MKTLQELQHEADTDPHRLVYAGGEMRGEPGCKTCQFPGMSWYPGFEGSVSQSCPACFPRYGKPNWWKRKQQAEAQPLGGLFEEKAEASDVGEAAAG